MKELLLQYTSYNVWANQKILNLLSSLPAELMTKEIKSSFPSIRKTILHIWDAETIWIKRLHGESILTWPSKTLAEDASVTSMIDTSKAFNEYCTQKEEAWFHQSTNYINISGEKFSTKNSGIVMHVMNHGTFHRGQIISMLRNAGVDSKIDSTDLISFLRL
jgi:uncharacterized damage-inducible protein DinB